MNEFGNYFKLTVTARKTTKGKSICVFVCVCINRQQRYSISTLEIVHITQEKAIVEEKRNKIDTKILKTNNTWHINSTLS